MKRIRWWHKFTYRLFYATWSPLLEERPDLALFLRDWIDEWLKSNGIDKETQKKVKKK